LNNNSKKGNFIVSSEILNASPNIEDNVIRALKALKSISEADPAYQFDERYFLDYKTTDQRTTSKFINELISKVSDELQMVLNNTRYDLSKEVENKLWGIVDSLQQGNKNVLWQEGDHDITTTEQLKKYFTILKHQDLDFKYHFGIDAAVK